MLTHNLHHREGGPILHECVGCVCVPMVLMTAVIAGFAEYGSDLCFGHVLPTVYGYDQCVHCDLYLLPNSWRGLYYRIECRTVVRE